MEKLLQYAWQYRLWENAEMKTTAGQRLEVLDPGWLNCSSGPDFFNSKLIIDKQQWAGNVEIHTRASDWFRHGHQNDKAYDSVILHVVSEADVQVSRNDGSPIPQIEFKPRVSLRTLDERVRNWHGAGLLCSKEIAGIPSLYLTDMLDSLAYQRLHSKADRFRKYLELSGGDYEQALFVSLARALGFGTNSEPMERTALAVPLSIYRKHSDNLLSLEAILLGQAGLIRDYEEELRREYDFMRLKFSLVPVRDLMWKHSGTRPVNFPERRLRLLARMLQGGFNKMGAITGCKTADDIAREIIPDGSGLSAASVSSIITNAVIPALFTYGLERRNDSMTELAVELLHQLPAERNRVCSLFEDAGIKTSSAYHTQALLELRSSYCCQRKCLYCRIGNRILRKK